MCEGPRREVRRKGPVLLGLELRRKGHAATGNGKEWTRGGWNSDGIAVPRRDVQWIRTETHRYEREWRGTARRSADALIG